MPLGEIAAGFLEVLGRFFFEIFAHIIFELLIKGSGYLILKNTIFRKERDLDPDGAFVILTGIIFWILIGFSIYYLYIYFTT